MNNDKEFMEAARCFHEFRHTFMTDAAFESLVISMQRDDGVIVYLDGVEVGRNNIGPGREAYDLYAPSGPIRFYARHGQLVSRRSGGVGIRNCRHA